MRILFFALVIFGSFACKNSSDRRSGEIDLSGDTLFIQPPAFIIATNCLSMAKTDITPEMLQNIVVSSFVASRSELSKAGASTIMGNFSFVAVKSKNNEVEFTYDLLNSGGFALAWPEDGKPVLYSNAMKPPEILRDVLGVEIDESHAKDTQPQNVQ